MSLLHHLPVDIQKKIISDMEGKPSVDALTLSERFKVVMEGNTSDPYNSPSDMDLIKHECTNPDGTFNRSRYDLFSHVFSKGFQEAIFGKDLDTIVKPISFKGARTYETEHTR